MHQFAINGSISTRRREENPLEGGEHRHARQKQVKVKQNINVREGTQHNTIETKIKTITT
jgi:hypothetical protein